jgi:phage terminase large subunit-like protein
MSDTLDYTNIPKAKDIIELRTRDRYEGNLSEFIKDAWPWIDSSEFKPSWIIDAMCDHLENVTYGNIKRLLINVPPRCSKTSISSICWPAWTWARSEISFTSGPQVRFLTASYNDQLSLMSSTKMRRLLLSPFYQRFWGSRFALQWDQKTKAHFDNTAGGSRLSTSVRGGLLGLGGDVLAVDDPQNTETEKVIETDADRNRVASWWQELSSTRLNDPKQSAIVVCMQRLHESDLSGVILDSEEEFVHLMVPMRYDESRHCVTVKLPQYENAPVWEDPRGEIAAAEGHDGQLMWPERFGEKEVEHLEQRLGPYMCTPDEAPVLMSDLSLKAIVDVNVGDEIIGFTTDTAGGSVGKFQRRKLVRTRVTGKTTLEAPIVKITMHNGQVVRCTPEHRWYMGKNGGRRGKNDVRPLYRHAVVGRYLMRVCPATLPELTKDEERLAGWLSGFFDGEGTVGLGHSHGRGRPSGQISFTQGSGRNLPLCEKLEMALDHFGFDYGKTSKIRRIDRHKKTGRIVGHHNVRTYRISSMSLPVVQRFLHIVKPTKWRDRLQEMGLRANFIHNQEWVETIEPDGVGRVHALETETGNYVVWGLASANSAGRLQQMPVPKGGGIILRDWWKPWDEIEAAQYGLTWNENLKEFPHFELVWGSLDTAFKEKEENDFSAMTIWGLWMDRTNTPRVMLMYGWAKRLRLHGPVIEQRTGEANVNYKQRQQAEWGLIEWIADTAKRYKIQRLLIEDKSRGYDVAMEINRLYAREKWGVELLEPVGDKVSRAHSCVPCFTDGAVWAPFIKGYPVKWANDVITQCLVAGTLIITDNGVIPIEDICVGDRVLTHKGRFRPVLATGNRKATQLINIQPSRLDALTLTAEHPFYAVHQDMFRKKVSAPTWVMAGDLVSRKYRKVTRGGKVFAEAYPSPCHAVTLPVIQREQPIDEIDLREWATLPSGKDYEFIDDGEFMRTSHWRSQSMRWKQPLDKAFGRIIGLFLAEGCGRRNQVSWSFHVKETTYIKEVRDFVEKRLGCRSFTGTQKNCTVVYANLPLIESFFLEFGSYAHDKRIPAWVWNATDEFIDGIVDGYMDGDGHEQKNRRTATTVSSSLAWGIRLLALRVGKRASVRVSREAGEHLIGGRMCKTRKVYSVGFVVERENDGSAKIVDNLAAYSVMKSTKIKRKGLVYNLHVAEDESYCTTGGLVHNCSQFPKATHDDLLDTITQSLNWARVRGLILRGDEVSAALADESKYLPKPQTVAESYGI